MVSEQFSYHPPITSLHVSVGGGQHEVGSECALVYVTSYRLRSKFHGYTFEAWTHDTIHIVVRDKGDHFGYDQEQTFVNIIVVGSVCIDNVVPVQINDVLNGEYVVVVDLKRYCSSSSSSSSSFSFMMMAASSMSSMSISSGGDRAQRDKSDPYGMIQGSVRHKHSGTVYHNLSGN